MTRNQSNAMHPADSRHPIPRRSAIKMVGLGAATTVLTPLIVKCGQAKSQT